MPDTKPSIDKATPQYVWIRLTDDGPQLTRLLNNTSIEYVRQDIADERVRALREALEFYADPSNLEQFVNTEENLFKDTSWSELDPEISATARTALRGKEKSDV